LKFGDVGFFGGRRTGDFGEKTSKQFSLVAKLFRYICCK